MNTTTKEALETLVKSHRKDQETPLIFAAWFRTADVETIHLLEVCEGVSDPGDASWMTLEFLPPPELQAFAKRLLVTYLSPGEFSDADTMPESEGRRVLEEIRRDGWEVLFVDKDNAEALKVQKIGEPVHATATGQA
jgi:hypothetical protein